MRNLLEFKLMKKKKVSDPVNDPVKSVEPLNSRELQVLEVLKSNPSASRNDIADRLRCSDSTVKKALGGFVRKGAIERIGSDKTGEWKIKCELPR